MNLLFLLKSLILFVKSDFLSKLRLFVFVRSLMIFGLNGMMKCLIVLFGWRRSCVLSLFWWMLCCFVMRLLVFIMKFRVRLFYFCCKCVYFGFLLMILLWREICLFGRSVVWRFVWKRLRLGWRSWLREMFCFVMLLVLIKRFLILSLVLYSRRILLL